MSNDWLDMDVEVPEDDQTENARPVFEDREKRIKPRGKYAAISAKLPVLIARSAEYQEKIEAAKQVIREAFEQDNTLLSAVSLANHYAEVYNEKEELKRRIAELNLDMEATGQMLTTAFESEGGYSVDTAHGRRVTMQTEPYASVIDRDVFREWCMREGLERSLQLPWSTTNALAKKMLLDGKEPPPGVKCFMKIKPQALKTE